MRSRRWAAVGVLAVVLAGCLERFGPDVGPRQPPPSDTAGGACDDDSDPAVAVAFGAQIFDGVFARGNCLRCHQAGGDGEAQSGLDLSSYATLREGGQRSGADIVITGQPCSSVLPQKLGSAPPFGDQMPRGEAPLSDADRQLIHDWIAEGARDN